MNISLKGLPVGEWRDLTEDEMKIIYSMIGESSGVTEKKSGSKPKTKPANSAIPSRTSASGKAKSEPSAKRSSGKPVQNKNRKTAPKGRHSKPANRGR
jgi:23S rRNA pseudouridine2604 synthase